MTSMQIVGPTAVSIPNPGARAPIHGHVGIWVTIYAKKEEEEKKKEINGFSNLSLHKQLHLGESCPLLVLACANGHLRTELPWHHAPKIPPQTSRVSPKPKDL